MSPRPPASPEVKRERREEILRVAGELFQRGGFHNVGLDQIGNALGISGPALYGHFDSKSALLVALMDRIVEEISGPAPALVESCANRANSLVRLVDHHVDVALRKRSLILLWAEQQHSLPAEDRGRLRKRQRDYVELWIECLSQVRGSLQRREAMALVHGTIGFIGSIGSYDPPLEIEPLRQLLRSKALDILGVADS